MSKRKNVTLADGEAAIVEALDRVSKQSDDIPALSQARIMRLLMREGIDALLSGDLDIHDQTIEDEIDAEMLSELVPDHVRVSYMRDEIKDTNRVADLKGGFEGRVRSEFRKRFRNGYDPGAIAELAEGYILEAQIYWQTIEDDPETYQQKVEFINDRVSDYRASAEVSNYDPDAEWLSFSGVEEGSERRQIEQSSEEIIEDIRSRFKRDDLIVGGGRDDRSLDPDAVIKALSNKHGVSEQRVRDLIESIMSSSNNTESSIEELGNGDGAIADGGRSE